MNTTASDPGDDERHGYNNAEDDPGAPPAAQGPGAPLACASSFSTDSHTLLHSPLSA